MVFCKHCGKQIPMEDATYCPACGRLQTQQDQHPSPTQHNVSTIVTTSTRNPGTAVLIALIAGFFGFQGIGHMYIGKIAYGLGLLLIGWTLGIAALLFLIGGVIAITVLLWIISFAFWIWQTHNANKLAKYYNEYLVQKGVAPW
ncbi:hypothetical protein BH23THE1_BH23THE1_12420 [soil metagenome]